MTKRPKPGSRLRQGTQALLERRGMMAAAPGGKPRPIGPELHTQLSAAQSKTAAYGSYAALAGQGGRRVPEERAHTGSRPGHAELKGHRHRGAERHSAH
ncbi:hypothetical protein LN042_18130 [Kitasatospora sp. RB6PN24]|uniref:hypothetical protein n=1 Tax=Kitasatospora humi TaxID=2893891 RepID=UPI001E551A87|nr:hypothetical protein [Kitasatospora humi]MCC9308984.1 hypothetical protein [Kitasatospora humi]